MADTYFPLCSNASSLVAGSAANAVVRRIKAAALLGDVLTEEGTYTVNADSTRGSFGSWSSPQSGNNAHWQSARERARHKQTPFGVTAQREGAQTPPATPVSGLAEISWRATFTPVKAQLPHAYPWIRFDHVELPSEADQLVHSAARACCPFWPAATLESRAALLTKTDTKKLPVMPLRPCGWPTRPATTRFARRFG